MERRIGAFVAVLLLVGLFFAALFYFTERETPADVTPLVPDVPDEEILATVEGETISVNRWLAYYALDIAMSRLAGQAVPEPRETLDRLINEQLLLQAYPIEEPPSDEAVAARVRIMEDLWDVEPVTLTASLESVGLTRRYFTETLRHLLSVEEAQTRLAQEQDPEAWIAETRAEADVEIDEERFAEILSQFTAPPSP